MYFAHENAYVSPSARVIFTLDYAGLGNQVSLLDGGLDAWKGAGHGTTTDVPPAQAGTLAPLSIRPIVVDAAYVLANLKTPDVSVVDGRAAAFYSGAQTGGNPAGLHKTGHIDGAKSVPFSDTVDAANVLKPEATLRKRLRTRGSDPAIRSWPTATSVSKRRLCCWRRARLGSRYCSMTARSKTGRARTIPSTAPQPRRRTSPPHRATRQASPPRSPQWRGGLGQLDP